MSVLGRVEAVLNGRTDWRAELARSLAGQMDAEPNASLARELRALMDAIGAEAPGAGGTPLDELARRREAAR